MNVSNLQQFLGQIGILVRSAGAAERVCVDIDRVAQCLQPFGDRTLSEFSAFLEKADEYDRTGKLTVPPPKATRTKKEAQPKRPVMSVDEAVARFNAVYEQAKDSTFEYSAIDMAIDEFEPIKATQLKEVAKLVNVPFTSKTTKPQLLDDFKKRIRSRKASFEGGPQRPAEPAANTSD